MVSGEYVFTVRGLRVFLDVSVYVPAVFFFVGLFFFFFILLLSWSKNDIRLSVSKSVSLVSVSLPDIVLVHNEKSLKHRRTFTTCSS